MAAKGSKKFTGILWQGRKGNTLGCWLQASVDSLYPSCSKIVPPSCCPSCLCAHICSDLSCSSFAMHSPHSSELHLPFSFLLSTYSPLCTFVRLLSFFFARALIRRVEGTAQAASLLLALLSGSTEAPDRQERRLQEEWLQEAFCLALYPWDVLWRQPNLVECKNWGRLEQGTIRDLCRQANSFQLSICEH